jgi:hypothetical protein
LAAVEDTQGEPTVSPALSTPLSQSLPTSQNADYERVGGRDTSHYFGAQIIHYGTAATAQKIMRFDASVSGDGTGRS